MGQGGGQTQLASLCFPKEKMEEARSVAANASQLSQRQWEGQKWSPGLGTREPPRKPLPTLHLEYCPIGRSKTEDLEWEMDDPSQGHHHPMLRPPRD